MQPTEIRPHAELDLSPWTGSYGPPLSVAELAERLLRFCLAESDRFFEEMNEPAARIAKGRCIQIARDLFRVEVAPGLYRPAPSRLDSDRVRSVVDLLSSPIGHEGYSEDRVVRARAIAMAIDQEYEDAMFSEFRNWRREQLNASDDCFPVEPHRLILAKHPDLKVFHRAYFPARRYDDSVDSLRHIRLAPSHLPLRLQQHFGFASQLSFLNANAPLRFAVGTLGAVDFAQLQDFYQAAMDGPEQIVAEAGIGFFREVTPREQHCSPDHLVQFVRQAAEAQVDVLLFPELCLSPGHLTALELALEESACTHPRLVIGGSMHCSDANLRKNRLYAFMRDANGRIKGRVTHDKIGTFHFPIPGQPTLQLVEDIHKNRELTVYLSENTSVAFLVCADFLQRSVQRALSILGVRQIFVSSLTKETAEFTAFAHQLAVADNATTMMAASTSLDQATATLVLPFRKGSLQLVPNRPRPRFRLFGALPTGQTAGIVVFSLPHRDGTFAENHEWHPCIGAAAG